MNDVLQWALVNPMSVTEDTATFHTVQVAQLTLEL